MEGQMKLITSPRRPPGPREGDIETALSLMTFLGGDPKSRQHLEDLLSVVQHNEALLSDISKARADLAGLEKREAALIENEARADAKLSELQVIRESFKKYDADYNA